MPTFDRTQRRYVSAEVTPQRRMLAELYLHQDHADRRSRMYGSATAEELAQNLSPADTLYNQAGRTAPSLYCNRRQIPMVADRIRGGYVENLDYEAPHVEAEKAETPNLHAMKAELVDKMRAAGRMSRSELAEHLGISEDDTRDKSELVVELLLAAL